ncbi:lactonase family protein [Occallatibacter riparius]|uniref:Lactonase family protein n=1 Tax=Occallatibacter riparius TaxID=1002689 RepID=A0A9J7BVQ5_9BACT|nr:lactonase family protein [Occallatibacter riparius]UWZ86720.1 lactonase family protein [Occallatibacter riparius]
MNRVRWAHLALGLAVLLTGCSGFWDKPSGGGGGGGGNASGVFYVLNQTTQQVVGFAFASGSTTPKAVTGGSASLGVIPYAMAIAPGGGFLYVSTGGGIFAYSIASSGALTLLNNSQAISQDLPTSMAVDGTGTWLIESIGGSGILNAIPISASTGILDTARTVQTAQLPNTFLNGIAASPANQGTPYIFVAMGTGGTEILPFTANSTGNPFGTLSNIKVLKSGGGATAIAVDPTNRLLYVGETVAVSGTQTGGLRVFTISSTHIAEVSGSPYATAGAGPSAIVPLTNYVYVANKTVTGAGTTSNITGFPIVSTGGVYSLGAVINTINAGTNTVGLAQENTGTYLLAVNAGGSPDLSTYTYDTTTPGKLVAGATASTGTDPTRPNAIVAVP